MENSQRYKTPISFDPALPLLNNNLLNADQTLKWINAHPRDMQGSIGELAMKVEHISFNEFNENFKVGICSLNALIKHEKVHDYMVMVEPGKSNQWMCEIAYPLLSKTPTQIYSLGKRGINFHTFLADEQAKQTPHYPDTVVFFDDGIYSGKQMSSYVKGVFTAIKNFNQEATKRKEDEIEYPQIVIISPYTTEFGEKTLYTVNEENKDKIYLTPHEKIKTLAETLTPYAANQLNQSLWKSDPRDNANKFSLPYQRGAESRGNIWFDHKIPNWLSFVHALEYGIVTDTHGNTLNGDIVKNVENEPVFNAFSDQKYSPIPATTPPYKKQGSAAIG